MREDLLREIAQEYLVPFFSGATLLPEAERSTPRDQLVAYGDPCSVSIKVDRADTYRLVISRSQPFTASAGDKIPERAVIQSFVHELASFRDLMDTDLRRDLLSTFQRRVVARALLGGRFQFSLLGAIDQLSSWGARLYEGSPISAAIGLRNMRVDGDGVSLSEISKEDFGAVISNGHDTILEFAYSGPFVRHQTLALPSNPPPFCPIRQAGVAEWTTGHEDRIALTLNRLGEILVFRDHMLVFARRSGRWHFLTHDPVIKQMNVPRDPDLRRAIYETCLDASFARSGACIGVVQTAGVGRWRDLVSDEDLIATGSSTKAKTIKKVLANRDFKSIDRRVRQELVAIDGATILSHTGQVLAVGAILKLPSGGSAGGGRLAAARALSKAGLGIKVSQDGGISGFRQGKAKPAFRVM